MRRTEEYSGGLRTARAVVTILAATLALGALSTCGGERDTAPRPRLLVVGWDGASFDAIEPMLREGRLPHLAGLLERGSSAVLESTRVPISSAAWTGATTGMGPGRTGVYGFFEPDEDGQPRLVSARSNRAAPLWRILTHEERRSVVFGVPMTYPPEPILGVLVAGMLSPFQADYAWPPGLADELRARGFEPDLGTWREDRPLTGGHVTDQIRLKGDLVVELLESEPWELAMIVFKSLDVVSHRAYGDDFLGQVAPVYAELDAQLGRLLAVAGEANVIVLSDHGFRSYRRGFDLHAWLLEEGFSVRRDDAPKAPGAGDGPLAARRATEIRARRAELDLDRTRALAAACEGNVGSVRLSLAGRDAGGTLEPREAEGTLAELAERLLALRDVDGDPLIELVVPGHELYPGPHAERIVPDLVFEAVQDVQVVARGGGQVLGVWPRAIPAHSLEGVWISAGPDFAQRQERDRADVFDLAPTALQLLGLPLDGAMQGRARSELLSDPREPMVVPSDELLPSLEPRLPPLSPDEVEEIEGRLRALGYGD